MSINQLLKSSEQSKTGFDFHINSLKVNEGLELDKIETRILNVTEDLDVQGELTGPNIPSGGTSSVATTLTPFDSNRSLVRKPTGPDLQLKSIKSDDLTASYTTDEVDINLENTGVTSGSYTMSNITVDPKGRITDISSGENTDVSFDNLTVNQDATVSGNLTVNGTTTTLSSQDLLIEDCIINLCVGNTDGVSKPGGMVINTDGDISSQTTISSIDTVGTITTVDSDIFSSGDIIEISSANIADNNGLYIVSSHSGTSLTIDSTPAFDFFNTSMTIDVTSAGTITKMNISVLYSDDSGNFFTRNGLTESDLISNVKTVVTQVQNTASASAGEAVLVSDTEGPTPVIRKAKAGSGLSITQNADDFEIANTAQQVDTTLTSTGTGTVSIVSSLNAVNNPRVKTINPGSGISIQENSSNALDIVNTDPNVDINLQEEGAGAYSLLGNSNSQNNPTIITIDQGSGIGLNKTGNILTITNTSTNVNSTLSEDGTGTYSLLSSNNSTNDHRVKTIEAGSNISMNEAGNILTISNDQPDASLTSDGSGIQTLVSTNNTTNDLRIKSINAGSDLTISNSSNVLTFTNSSPNIDIDLTEAGGGSTSLLASTNATNSPVVKKLTAGTNVNFADVSNELTINASSSSVSPPLAIAFSEKSLDGGNNWQWNNNPPDNSVGKYELDTSVIEFNSIVKDDNITATLKENGVYEFVMTLQNDLGTDIEVRTASGSGGSLVTSVLVGTNEQFMGHSTKVYYGYFDISSAPTTCYFYNTDSGFTNIRTVRIMKIT